MKKKKSKPPKEKKKKLPLRRTVQNNLFALRCIWMGSPLYLIVYLGSSLIYGTLDFLGEGYLLRRIVNGVEAGEDIAGIMRFVVLLGLVSMITYTALEWFWNVISPVKQRRVGAYVEKMLFRKAAQVELA